MRDRIEDSPPGGESRELLILHPHPVWMSRATADAVVLADDDSDRRALELLPILAEPSAPRRATICALPFFVYGYSVGDVVEVDDQGRIGDVVTQSSSYTYRVALIAGREAALSPAQFIALRRRMYELDRELTALGYLTEWYSSSYGAIGATSYDDAEKLVQLLEQKKRLGEFLWESGA